MNTFKEVLCHKYRNLIFEQNYINSCLTWNVSNKQIYAVFSISAEICSRGDIGDCFDILPWGPGFNYRSRFCSFILLSRSHLLARLESRTQGRNFNGCAEPLTLFLADLKSGFIYKYPLTPYWNGLMLPVLYLVVVFLRSAFQAAHYHLKGIVQQRTAALQAEIAERKRLAKAKIQAERMAPSLPPASIP